MNRADKEKRLKEIAHKVGNCKKCSLWRYPKAVPGEGNPDAKILFVGEAPGYHESAQGEPFVGMAGQLLTRLLKSVNLERSEVFICNMLRHRPPENRDPLPEEIKACEQYLDAQIRIINPKIIVTLGRFSMNKFLPGEYISNVHGQSRYVDFGGKRRIVIPMYHPAAALRNGAIMDQLVSDFQKISSFLEDQPKPVEKEQTQLSLIN